MQKTKRTKEYCSDEREKVTCCHNDHAKIADDKMSVKKIDKTKKKGKRGDKSEKREKRKKDKSNNQGYET